MAYRRRPYCKNRKEQWIADTDVNSVVISLPLSVITVKTAMRSREKL